MLLAHCGRLSHCLSGGQSKWAGPYSVGLSVSLLYRFVASIVFRVVIGVTSMVELSFAFYTLLVFYIVAITE